MRYALAKVRRVGVDDVNILQAQSDAAGMRAAAEMLVDRLAASDDGRMRDDRRDRHW